MQVVYDPRHVLHDPVTEVQYGVAMPVYEVPARVESIRTALLADDTFSFADPAGHGLEPVLAVHHEGLVNFLGEAWGRWRAHGGGGRRDAAPVHAGHGPAPGDDPAELTTEIYWRLS